MNDIHDPWTQLSPRRPPIELRERVLSAAREAAARPAPGLLATLYRDRLLRLCAAGLAALVIANVLVADGGGAHGPVAAAFAVSHDEENAPGDAGLRLAEQIDELAPVLGGVFERSRG